MKNKNIWLSLFLIFHLFVIVTVPNQHSILSQKLKPILIAYGNTLHINSLWQFFSPDPAPAIFYEYTVVDSKDQRNKYYYPDLHPPGWSAFFSGFRNSYNRQLTLARITLAYPQFFEKLVVPYLCRLHPEAVSLDIVGFSTKFPTLQEVEQGRPLNDLEERDFRNMGEFSCFR